MNITKDLALQIINNYMTKTGYLCIYCKDDNGIEFEIKYKESFISVFPEGTMPPKNYKGYKGGVSLHHKDGQNFYVTCGIETSLVLDKVPYIKAVRLFNKYDNKLKTLLEQKRDSTDLRTTIDIQKQINTLARTTREALKCIYDKAQGEDRDLICDMIINIK